MNKNNPKLKFFSLLGLFLFPPLLIVIGLFWLDYEEIKPFYGPEMGRSVFALNDRQEVEKVLEILPQLADALYEFQKDQPGSQIPASELFSKVNKENDATKKFRDEVSKKFTEKLGILASLPYHRVCLRNQNTIQVKGETIDNPQPPAGALSINQIDGYKFYALPRNQDCKNVSIGVFKNSTSTIEYNYITYVEHNSTSIEIASTSVNASNSKITISLTSWVLVVGYFLILFGWSFVFFQIIKITNYFIGMYRKF
jgi:hypothetical protein